MSGFVTAFALAGAAVSFLPSLRLAQVFTIGAALTKQGNLSQKKAGAIFLGTALTATAAATGVGAGAGWILDKATGVSPSEECLQQAPPKTTVTINTRPDGTVACQYQPLP